MNVQSVNQYCSSSCRKAGTKKKSIERIRNGHYGKAICLVCNTEFNKAVKNQIYCSKECFKKSHLVEGNGELLEIQKNSWLRLRFEIFKRDNFTCQYCGRNVKNDGVKLHCDHIKPRNSGGLNNIDNLITSCMECNIGKSDVLLDKRLYEKKQ